MNCVKCGREIEENQVFCPDCLTEMDGYPVKPGIVVHIPKHSGADEEKKSLIRKKPILTPEEQIRKLKRRLLWARMTVAALLLACGILCFVVGKVAVELDFYRIIGQNYSTVETANTTRTPKNP